MDCQRPIHVTRFASLESPKLLHLSLSFVSILKLSPTTVVYREFQHQPLHGRRLQSLLFVVVETSFLPMNLAQARDVTIRQHPHVDA